jgi:TonB-dependent siderophore receptor
VLALAGAAAQTAPTFTFDVAPQPLSTAVLAFVRQANVQVVFGAPVAQGLMSAPLAGRYSLQDAITHLLAGTGLDWRMASGTITITPAAPSGTLTFSTVTVEGTRPPFPEPHGFGPGAGANGSSDPIATEGTHSFTTNGTIVASGIPQSLLHTPQTVGVITSAQIQQQNLTDVNTALAYMPGITLTSVTANSAQYLSRSFYLSHYRLDGGASLHLADLSLLGADADLSEFDNIQVLRGSDGLLGGDEAPGGVLNLQRKRPLDHAQFLIDVDGGSWNDVHGEIDASGPLGFDGHLRARAVLSATDRDEFYDLAHQTRAHLYGVIEGDLDPDTILRAGASFDTDIEPGFDGFGLPRGPAAEDPGLARSTCLCATWNRLTRNTTEMFAALDHRFGDNWTLKGDATLLDQTGNETVADVSGALPFTSYNGSQSTVFRQNEYALSMLLNGTFQLGDLDQQVVAGVQYTRGSWSLIQNATLPGQAIAVDPFHFDPHLLDPEPAENPTTAHLTHVVSEEAGLYAGLTLQPFERAHITLGLRTSFDVEEQAGIRTHDDAIPTPSVAVSYDVAPEVAAYASYVGIYASQSFLLTEKLQPLPILTGRTHETGIKTAPWDGRLNASLALYYSEQANQAVPVTTTNPVPVNAVCCFVSVGAVKSTGIDLEVAGELLPAWQIQGGYTYNSNGYTNDLKSRFAGLGIGTSAFQLSQPRNQLKVWSAYDIDPQFSVGGGVRFESVRSSVVSACSVAGDPTCSTGTIRVTAIAQPAYAVLDLRAAYRINARWEAAINVTNVTDTRYFTTLGSTIAGNFYGAPRGFQFSLRGSY